jgi:hypothetical protein
MKITEDYILDCNIERIKRLYRDRLARKEARRGRGKGAGKRSVRPVPQESVTRDWRYSVPDATSIAVGDFTRPCPACRHPMELRTHDLIYPANQRPQLLGQKCYHTSWWYCANRKCSTGAVYDKEFMVVNKARNWKCMEEA